LRRARVLVARSRKLSVPVSMMWALNVTRSTMAATRRGSGMTVPHSLKGGCWPGRRWPFLAFGEDLEQQLGAAGIELHVAELVHAEQVEAAVAGEDTGQAPFIRGFGELVDELGGRGVADLAALLASGHAEADEQVRDRFGDQGNERGGEEITIGAGGMGEKAPRGTLGTQTPRHGPG